MKCRLLVFLVATIPLAIFFAARQAASWRPQLVYQSAEKSEIFLISPSARWMLCRGDASNQHTIVDLRSNVSNELPTQGALLKFTADEDAAFFNTSSGYVALYALPSGQLRQSFPIPPELFPMRDVQFSADQKRLVGVNEAAIVTWDSKTGRIIGQRQRQRNANFPMMCGVQPEIPSFSFVKLPVETILSRNGSLLRKDGKTFSVATGEQTNAPNGVWKEPGKFVEYHGSNFLRVLDRETGKVQLEEPSVGSDFTPDYRWLLNATSENEIQLIDAQNWRIVAQRQWHKGAAWAAIGTPDFVLSADAQGRIWRWRLR